MYFYVNYMFVFCLSYSKLHLGSFPNNVWSPTHAGRQVQTHARHTLTLHIITIIIIYFPHLYT